MSLNLKYKGISMLFLSLFFHSTFLKSDIQKIDSFFQAKNNFYQADKGTLIVFDLDNTLMNTIEKAYHIFFRKAEDYDPSNIAFASQISEKINDFIKTKNISNYTDKILAAIFAKLKFIPAEPEIIPCIQSLQKNGIKIIALTGTSTGKYGEIEDMQKWRESSLNQIGLDFSSSFDIQKIVFDNLPGQPTFNDGILCSANYPKGKMLKVFFEKTGWKPNKIIFFDDRYDHCKNVEKEMEKLNINTKCFWYRGVFKEKIKLNQDVIQYQFDHWIKHEEFLTEAEIQTKIQPDQISKPKNSLEQTSY